VSGVFVGSAYVGGQEKLYYRLNRKHSARNDKK